MGLASSSETPNVDDGAIGSAEPVEPDEPVDTVATGDGGQSADPGWLLWRDPAVLGIRTARATAARIAVRRALERRALLAGDARADEYFELDDYLADYLDEIAARLGAPAADRISGDPYAYSWARLAFELVGTLVRGGRLPRVASAFATEAGTTDTRELLGRHLLELKRLVLGAAVLGGRSIQFPTPLRIETPLAIPGTVLTVMPHGGSAAIEGAFEGLPFGPGDLHFEECPVVRRGVVELRLQPYAYGGISGIEFAPLVLEAGLQLQRRNAPRLEQALELVERHQPTTFAQLGAHLRVIAFKDPTSGSTTNNITHTDLPGAFVASTVRNRWYLADVVIHEFHHNRLSCIEELGGFFADAGGDDTSGSESEPDPEAAAGGGGRYVSPWRKDLRPLLGIVHGAYVHVPCTRFWLDVLAAGDLDGSTRALALDRALRGHLQLRCALVQIERHALLSPLGERVLAGLRQGEAELRAAIRSRDLPADAQVTRCEPDGEVRLLTRDDGSPLLGRDAVREHFAALEAEDVALEALV